MFNFYPTARLCPLCDSEVYKRKFRRNAIWICQCQDCGHLFADLIRDRDSVHEIYDGQYFQGDGVGYVDYLAEGHRLLEKGQYYGKLLEQDFWPGSLLDVGTAGGFMLSGLNASGWQGVGLEPNHRIAEYGRQQLKLKIHEGSLEDFKGSTPYDFVCMIQVLSHFYDVKRALQMADEVTRPGGFWLIETWNRNSLSARLQGKRWRAYQPPADVQWFSTASLTELVSQYGFSLVRRGRVKVKLDRPQMQQYLRYQGQGWGSKILAALLSVIPASITIPWTIRDRMWFLFEKEALPPEPPKPPASTAVPMQTFAELMQEPFSSVEPPPPPTATAWAAKLPTPPRPSNAP